MINVKYIPCIFEDTNYEFETHNLSIRSIFISLIKKFPDLVNREAGFQIRVNGKILPIYRWTEHLQAGDRVLIIQEIGLGTEFVILGVTLTVWQAISIVYTIVSIAYTIYSYCNPAKPPQTGKGLNSSPTYGWDGAQMQSRQGVPVPIVYGEHLAGGNLIEAYISSDVEKNYLNLLIALSEGEIEGIMKEDLSGVCTNPAIDIPYILINDNPISNFTDLSWDYRLGTQDQTQIPGFGDVCQTYSLGSPKVTATPYIYTTVDSDVEAFEVRVRAPGCYIQYKGNYYPRTISAHIDHKLHTEPTEWTSDGDIVIVASSQNPVRRFFRLDSLSPDQYDIRVTLTAGGTDAGGPGDLYLDNIIEIKYDTLCYPHTALLAIQILATDKLANTIPNVLTRFRGIKTKNLDTENVEWTENPIYNINDLLVNPRYGVGKYITQPNINNDQLILEAEHCDEILGDGTIRVCTTITETSITDADYEFVAGDIGKYICCKAPSDSTVYTVLLITSLTGYHQVNGSGWSFGTPVDYNWEFGEKRYELDLVIDAQNPAFDCIYQACGSFRGIPIWSKDAIQILIEKKEIPSYIFNMGNVIEGSFKHTFASEKNKPNCLKIDYADKDKRFQKETVDYTDALTIAGGVPMVTRQMSLLGATRQSQIYREARFHLNAPKYQDEQISFKGAIDAIHMLPGDIIKFQHDVFSWGQGGRIVAATTTSVTLDQEVTIGANYIITCKLADDTLETRTISEGAGTYRTVHVTAAFTSPGPPIYGLYAIGLTTVEAKPFRIMSILKTPENEIEVVATEYNDLVYTDTDIVLAQHVFSPLPPDSQFPSDPDVPDPFYDSMVMSGLSALTGIRSIVLSWDDILDPTFFIAEIWRADINNRAGAAKIGTSTTNLFTDSSVTAGSTYYYWIRALSGYDMTTVGPWEPTGATSGVGIEADWAATIDVELFAITRGTQFYSGSSVHFDTATEVEIGTVTVYTNTTSDSVWLWTSITILAWPNDGSGKIGVSPITLRIRRTTTTGTLVTTLPLPAYAAAPPIDGVPIILQATDVPGGSVGAHIYKLTACTDHTLGVDHFDGQIGYASIMGMAKSR